MITVLSAFADHGDEVCAWLALEGHQARRTSLTELILQPKHVVLVALDRWSDLSRWMPLWETSISSHVRVCVILARHELMPHAAALHALPVDLVLFEHDPQRGAKLRRLLHNVDQFLTPPPLGPQGPRRSVLLIDDEPQLLRALKRMLSPFFHVETEPDSQQALMRLLAWERHDAVLCDVMMPVLSGVELYEALIARHHPAADRMLFMTGGVLGPKAQAFEEQQRSRILYKPLTRERVVQRVEALCASLDTLY